MKANNVRIIASLILLSGASLSAQEPDERLNREMTLEREYDPSLQDAGKINRLPEIKEPEVVKRAIDYSPFTTPADPEKDFKVLPPGSVRTEIPYSTRRGYFNFGGGMFMNLNGDADYHLLDTDKDRLNLYATHRSTNGNVTYFTETPSYPRKGQQKAFLNDNLVNLNYRHQFANSALRLGAEYSHTGFNYYGSPLIEPRYRNSSVWQGDSADRDTRQVNQTIRGYAGIRSNAESRIGYAFDLDWTHFSQKYAMVTDLAGIGEDRISGLLDLNARFGERKQRAGVTLGLNSFNCAYPFARTDSSPGYRKHLEATLSPYYRMDGETWHLKLGASVMLITGDSARIFASPNIAGDMRIADRTVFYLNAGGGILSNDAAGLSRQNRYMDCFTGTLPSRMWLDATTGIRSSITPDFWMNVFAGYRIIENAVFFVPGRADGTSFGNYSTAFQPDVSVFDAGLALKYSYRQMVDVSLKGVYHSCAFEAGDNAASTFGLSPAEMLPFGFPQFEVSAGLSLKPVRQLTVALDYYLGARRATLLYEQIIDMNHLNDLNLTASWNFNDTFGAWAKLNNILSQQQNLWYGYPMQRFNAMAGININF
jgi:hypothetical protein